jgi:hypothetical protein
MAWLQMDGNMLQCNTFTAGGETPPKTQLLNTERGMWYSEYKETDDYCNNGQLSCGQTLKRYFKQLVINIKSEHYNSQERKIKVDPSNRI